MFLRQGNTQKKKTSIISWHGPFEFWRDLKAVKKVKLSQSLRGTVIDPHLWKMVPWILHSAKALVEFCCMVDSIKVTMNPRNQKIYGYVTKTVSISIDFGFEKNQSFWLDLHIKLKAQKQKKKVLITGKPY